MSTTGPDKTARPVRRENLVERLNRDLAVAQIESLFDSYVSLMTRRQRRPGTRGWRSRLRRRIDAIEDLSGASELLYSMQVALDHDHGRPDPVLPSSLFEHPEAELSVDDSA